MIPIKRLWKENNSLLFFIALMLVFRSAVADWNDVPTGSMKPTIVEGDRILVNKLAYDVRVPFSHITLMKLSDPVAGDIIVFDSEAAGKRLVKRVIGVPGDVLAMKDNRLVINGEAVHYQSLSSTENVQVALETIGGHSHTIRTQRNRASWADFNAVTIPDGFYLALGDNRDNSADSRVIGFIPRGEIIGRSERVVLSLDYDNYLIPRPDRFWKSI